MHRRPFLLLLATLAGGAQAQAAWPARPVRIIAPQAPGGGVDLVGRIVAERLSRVFGHGFVIENQAGAGGSVATQGAARGAADGDTLRRGYRCPQAANSSGG